MAKVTNTSKGPVQIGDYLIAPNASVDIDNWDELAKNNGVKLFVKEGILSVEGGKSSDDDAEKEALIAEIKELGGNATKSMKVETLQAKLAELKAEE